MKNGYDTKGIKISRMFSINKKKLKGEFLSNILDNIQIKYKKLYPYYHITAEYLSRKESIFIVYANMSIIEDNRIIDKKVMLHEYKNIDAINNFATIPFKKYEEEYDDSLKNYLEEFEIAANAIITSYILRGHKIDPIEINWDHFIITIHSDNWYSEIVTIYGAFKNFNMITLEEKKNKLAYIKKELERKLSNE